jgi:outer membrane protein assembly factor BamB
MRKNIIRVAVAVAAGALSALGVSGAGASGAATRAGQPAVHPAATVPGAAAVPGAQLWIKRYNGPANGSDGAESVAVSPSGSTVFITGDSSGDYATVAYNAATGTQRWAKRYNGPGDGNDQVTSLAVSPGGGTVFVTGQAVIKSNDYDYATVAYNAATGAQRWVKRYHGPGNPGNVADYASSVAVSPGGGTVFVTGASAGATSDMDYATVAYNAATGAQRWVTRYNGPADGSDSAFSLAVSPGGGTVFVTGVSYGATSGRDYATVAYNAATGAQRWVKRYTSPGQRPDSADRIAVSPRRDTVFVTGAIFAYTDKADYATVAYNAVTGAQLWVKRYNGPGKRSDSPLSLAVSPGGGTVFVTGDSYGATSSGDYATVAYNAVTGAERWVKRYNGPGNDLDVARSVAVSPGGSTVFVTGNSYGATLTSDCATIAYNATTGKQLWVRRYIGTGGDNDGTAVAVNPSGDRVFVTGDSWRATSDFDYITIAYSS